MVGLGRLELPTSRLSGVRSNHLSYRPSLYFVEHKLGSVMKWRPSKKNLGAGLLRKEVIQPQVPLRLPCYDFTPITNHTLGHLPPLRVGASDFWYS